MTMIKKITAYDLFCVIAKDTGFSPTMFSGFKMSHCSNYLNKKGHYFWDQCNAACAWLERVHRTKNVNQLACGSLLKNIAGAYAGHYISAGALATAARYMGFNVLMEDDDFFLNISKRSIPHCIDGAFPPGSEVYIQRHYRRYSWETGHDTIKLPNFYNREW